jgi:GT2 family glycosyltransferase
LNADAEFSKFDFWGQVFQSRYLGIRVPNAFDTKFNAISRELFEKIHGFDEEHYAWGGEDFDFYTRVRPHGEIRDTGVEVEHMHGLGKPFSAMGTFKKYCRNAECMGITTPNYWRHRNIEPWFPRFLAMQFLVCATAISTLVPFWWPWTILLLMAMGIWWNKAAFLRVRSWRLIWLPFYSLGVMYCFTYYFLRGLILGRSLYKFDNKM